MLHIKDIEAFAHINEALARGPAAARTGAGEDDSRPAAHPALLLAMVATGRITPAGAEATAEEEGKAPPAGTDRGPAGIAGMMARLLAPPRR